MREAIGSSYVLSIVITFFALFIFFFVGTMAYTKAFKVKNKIIDEIEIYQGDILASNNKLDSNFQKNVDEKLSKIGYRISNKTKCDTDGRFGDVPLSKNGTSNYRYCIYKVDTNINGKSEQKGTYYSVVAYMYFEIPIIGAKLEFPVYGETKVFTELSK